MSSNYRKIRIIEVRISGSQLYSLTRCGCCCSCAMLGGTVDPSDLLSCLLSRGTAARGNGYKGGSPGPSSSYSHRARSSYKLEHNLDM